MTGPTPAEMAAITFEPWTKDFVDELPDNDEWARLANPHLVTVRIAALILTSTKDELVERSAGLAAKPVSGEAGDMLCDIIDRLGESRAWFAAFAEMLAAAHTRSLVAASVLALRAD